MCGFIAQLVEHRTGIAEVMGSNPVEALIFFRLLLSNCLNCLNLHREWHLLNTLKFFISYYIASSVSGQDAPNPVLWLATCCIHQETFLQKPLLK